MVTVGLEDFLGKNELGAQDHRKLGTGVEVCGTEVLVVDLLEGAEVNVGRCHAVNFGCFEDNAWWGRVGHLGSLPDERVEKVDSIELA